MLPPVIVFVTGGHGSYGRASRSPRAERWPNDLYAAVMGASSGNAAVGEAEPPWFEAAQRRYGRPLTVVGSRALGGGYVSDHVRLYELVAAGKPISVVWKRTTAREVAALRALDEVPGIGGPWLLAHGGSGSGVSGSAGSGSAGSGSGVSGQPGNGGCGSGVSAHRAWVLMPHHAGTPLVDGQPVPDAAYEVLARVHARYLGEAVPGLPVVDSAFWRRLCLDVALPAVRGAAARPADSADTAGSTEVYRDAEARLLAWSSDERMFTALSVLPATLAHGDLHRGNILAGPDDAVIIDWGGARIAPGGLDLAVLAEQGGVDHDRYHRRLAELSGRPVAPTLVEIEQQWALAMGYVQYLGFAADHLGADRVGVMVDRAARAFDQLGSSLAHI
jgi:hypothetical protein